MPYQRTKGIPALKFTTGPYCEGCSFRLSSRGFVPPVGGIARLMKKIQAGEGSELVDTIVGLDYTGMKRILVVGEAGGREEIESGYPFSGGAGYELDKVLVRSRCELVRAMFTITNVVKCRPVQRDKHGPYISPYTKDHKNRTPEPEMQRECYSRYLKHELAAFHGDIIIALGDIPLHNLTDKKGITKWRGTLQKDRVHGHPLMATFHPAFLMRKHSAFNVTCRDFARIPLYMKGDVTDKKKENYILHPEVNEIEPYFGRILSTDIETDGHLDPYAGNIGVIGFAPDTENALVYPYTGAYAQKCKHIIEGMPAILGQNMYGFDAYWFLVKGMKPPEVMYDTLTMHHLANSEGAHDLWSIHSEFAKRPVPSWKFKHNYKENLELVCARDVCNTREAYDGLETYLRKEGQWDVYVNDIIPLQHVLLMLRHRGVKINQLKMFAYHVAMDKSITKKERMLSGAIGASFNWRSPKQLAELLYDRMGLDEKTIRGTGKRTTNRDALEELWEENSESKILRVIMELRKLAKLDGTYFQLATDDSDRAHPQLLAHGTATGRLSCKDPTIHNIPDGPARSVFIPDEDDFRFVYGDYSQIEYLVQAWYSKEWDVLKRGLEGYDFHRMVASMFFNIPYDDIDHATRHKAKFIDFGLLYGRGPASIAKANNIDAGTVQNLIDKFFRAMPGTKMMRDRSIQHVRSHGHDETLFHRRRWLRPNDLPKIFNFKPQSTAAHVTNRSLVRVYKNEQTLKAAQYQLTPLTVHDSITVQCHKDQVDRVARWLRAQMTEPVPEMTMPGRPQGISFPVEIKTGSNWGTFHETRNPKGLKTWEFE